MIAFAASLYYFLRVVAESQESHGMSKEIAEANKAVRSKLQEYLFVFFLIWFTVSGWVGVSVRACGCLRAGEQATVNARMCACARM